LPITRYRVSIDQGDSRKDVLHEYQPGVAQGEVLKTPQLETNRYTRTRRVPESVTGLPALPWLRVGSACCFVSGACSNDSLRWCILRKAPRHGSHLSSSNPQVLVPLLTRNGAHPVRLSGLDGRHEFWDVYNKILEAFDLGDIGCTPRLIEYDDWTNLSFIQLHKVTPP
jgi:hypothetical protein